MYTLFITVKIVSQSQQMRAKKKKSRKRELKNVDAEPKRTLYVFLDMGGKDVILPKMETKSACNEIQEALYNQSVFFLIFINITN